MGSGCAPARLSVPAYASRLSALADPLEDFAGLVSARAISVIAVSSRHFRRVFFGYYGYPAYYGGDFYSTADYYPSYDYYGSSYYSAQNDVAQQQQDIDRLEDEVARLREQRESQQPETRAAPTPQPESRSAVSTPTLLVFRDKHTQEVQNYAIVGGTLWIFSEQRATKLPLSWLDIEATTKANEDRGVDFQLAQIAERFGVARAPSPACLRCG